MQYLHFVFYKVVLAKFIFFNDVHMALCVGILHKKIDKNVTPPGGLEPPTFRLTAERASRLRHGGPLRLRQFHPWN